MIKGVLFDMDGVLFDTERLHLEIDDQLLNEMGYRMSDEMREKTFGINSRVFQSLCFEYFGPAFDFETYVKESYRRFLSAIDADGMPVKPGAKEALERLKKRGLLLAVASSSREKIIAHHLAAAGFAGYFSAIASGDMVEHSKPAPDVFLLAAQKLGLAPAACAAVEDSFAGVTAAKAAGCLTVMVPDQMQPTAEIKKRADAIFPDLTGAAAYIEAAAGGAAAPAPL